MRKQLIRAITKYYHPYLILIPERQIFTFIKNHVKGEKLLDAGCGNGWLSLALAREGYQVMSLDFSKNQIKETKYGFRSFALYEYGILCASITDIPFSNDCFDTIICINVLEHISDITKAVIELNRVLRPGGRLIVMVPNAVTFGRVYDKFLYKYLPTQIILKKAHKSIFELTNKEVMDIGLDKEVPTKHVQDISFEFITSLLINNNFHIIDYSNFRLLGPYFRSLTNFFGLPPFTSLERFDFEIAQKVPYFLASEWLFCCEKMIRT